MLWIRQATTIKIMNRINAYKETTITTQTPGQIVVMLYDGAIRFLAQAVERLEQNDDVSKGLLINKAVNIINELDITLNREAGGQIAENLHQLYDFVRRHLFKASAKKDPAMICEVIKILEELNEGWKTIASQEIDKQSA